MQSEPEVIAFEYDEIKNADSNLGERIEKAFGDGGFGLCIVKNVPEFVQKRAELLPMGRKLAGLSKEELDAVTFEDQCFGIGWSHGKEKFKGNVDFSKGSFYANAMLDERRPKHDDAKAWKEFGYYPKEMPELKPALQGLGQLIIDTGCLLSHHIDKYVEKLEPKYEKGKLEKIIKETDHVIGRLLHYFPREEGNSKDNWCGTHNDLGSLTGLCSAMYFDKEGKETTFIDEETGLYCIARNGKTYKVKIPKDCLAFQIGETMQVHTGGRVIATPHFVKIGEKMTGTGICRNTFAVFMEPRGMEKMTQPDGRNKTETIGKQSDEVPDLKERWIENQEFEEFHNVTIKSYL